MDKNNVLGIMNSIPFFQDMDQNEREALAEFEDAFITRKAGEPLLNEGDVDRGFFVLMDGRLSIMRTQPTEVILAQLVPGALFGEVTLKAERIRTSSAMADDDILVLKVDPKLVQSLPANLVLKIKDQVIDLLISRLDEVNRKLGTFIR